MLGPVFGKLFSRLIGPVFGGGGSGPTPDPALAALKAAAVSLWTLDEPTGDYIDLIGANDLRLYSAARVLGKIGNASSGNGGRLECVNTDIFTAESRFVAFWVNPSSANFQGLLGMSVASFGSWGVNISNAGQYAATSHGIGGIGYTSKEIGAAVVSQWQLIVAVFDLDGGLIGGSVDGGTVSSAANVGIIDTTVGNFQVHGNPNIAADGGALIDELGVYAGTPTSEMIAALWNGGDGISNSTIAAA